MLKKIMSQTAVYGLSSIIGRLLNYLLVPLYTRLFTQAEYGVVTELYSYIGFMLVLLTYGMETAFFRFAKKQTPDTFTNAYSTAFSSLSISTLLFLSLSWLFSHNIAQSIGYQNHPEYIKWLVLIISFDVLSSLPFAKLRFKDKALKFALIKLIGIALNIGLVLFLLIGLPNISTLNQWYNPNIGVGYIFIANLIASAIVLLLLLNEMPIKNFKLDIQLWKKMMRYALPLVIVGLAGVINEMLDRILLKHFTNLEQVGIYGACYKLSILMTLFTQAFRYAAEPFFFTQSVNKNAPETYAKVMSWFVATSGLIFIGVVCFLDIFQYFIGAPFRVGLAVVPILLLANATLGIYYNLSIWYKLTDLTHLGAIISVIGASITIALNLLLIPTMGYMGSAWATLAAYATMAIISYNWGQRHYPIPYQLKSIISYLSIAIAIAITDQYLLTQLPTTISYTIRIIAIIAYSTYVLKSQNALPKYKRTNT